MKYSVSIDVPNLDKGIRFYCDAFGFMEAARPIESYAILKWGESEIGLSEKAPGSSPAEGSDDIRRYDRHWTPVHIDFSVEDLDVALARAVSAGAKCEQRFEAGQHPPVAFCSDPFGNGFCLIGLN
jgi:predicted enzyme related to lactoylglutathione lyase